MLTILQVGALFPFSVTGLSHLQRLDVSNNSLASLAFSENLALPALKTLDIANNRIVSLPDITYWSEIVTIVAQDNKISVLPPGFTTLKKVKQVDFTGNDLTKLDDAIGTMQSLEILRVEANPLKERKFLTMHTEQLKRELANRLGSQDGQRSDDVFEDEGIDIQSPAQAELWKVGSGVLDLADKDLVDDDADEIRSFLGAHDVRELVLAKNTGLSIIPFEISLAQNLRVLDLSGCSLSADYLTEIVNLKCLQELNLKGNKISSWDPLFDYFHAPRLSLLDISNNRLDGSLPTVRSCYPELRVLHAHDNKIDSISVEALTGLHSAGLSGNDIGHLPPEIGLLWDQGLKGLSVGNNAFRVPSYRVLEKGTEATLTWLREKIPDHGRVEEETF